MLRVKNPDAHLPAIRIDQRHGPPEVSAASLLLVGSPAESSVILRETRGHLHLGSNHPNLFMQVPDLLEIRGASAEFGMSGGLVTNSRGDFLGILASASLGSGSDMAFHYNLVLNWKAARSLSL